MATVRELNPNDENGLFKLDEEEVSDIYFNDLIFSRINVQLLMLKLLVQKSF
jgi:hypothetical protein